MASKSNHQRFLEHYFHIFNKKYFSSSLSTNTQLRWCLRFKKPHEKYYAVTNRYREINKVKRSKEDSFYIIISNQAKKVGTSFILMTLLHEMAHIATWKSDKSKKGHGPVWQKEMLRLAKMGAFKNLW